MRRKKKPLRRCVGCGERREKRELIRVVRDPQGELDIDDTGKKPGRGAYICPGRECLEKAWKNRGLEKSLRQAVPGEVKEELQGKIHG